MHARRPATPNTLHTHLSPPSTPTLLHTPPPSTSFLPESNWGANAGLAVARDLLEPVKQVRGWGSVGWIVQCVLDSGLGRGEARQQRPALRCCLSPTRAAMPCCCPRRHAPPDRPQKFPWISYGDLWTLAGATAIEAMGGPHIPWRPGRHDHAPDQVSDACRSLCLRCPLQAVPGHACCPAGKPAAPLTTPPHIPASRHPTPPQFVALPDGRLPDGDKDAKHVRDIFYR